MHIEIAHYVCYLVFHCKNTTQLILQIDIWVVTTNMLIFLHMSLVHVFLLTMSSQSRNMWTYGCTCQLQCQQVVPNSFPKNLYQCTPLPSDMGFPDSSDDKESVCNAGDLGSIPRMVRSPGEGNGNPLQCSCLENSMDRGTCQDTVHRVAESHMTEGLTIHTYHQTLWFIVLYILILGSGKLCNCN